ncbi:MAG TPA: hypothetical protein VHZ55_26310, partial [Bryobacteraceae bacterium]|nr:hypothetical protein [Bryobacteraceae bacterium]
PNTILTAAVLFAVSAAIWFHLAGSSNGRIMAVLLGLSLVGLITLNAQNHFIDVKYAKGQILKNEEFVRWNVFSRIALKRQADGAQLIVIDGDANTYVAQLDINHLSPKEKVDLTTTGPSFPYALRPGAKSLVIGPGGGYDVARAISSGSRDVTGVEINPIIAKEIMQKRYAYYSHGLYSRPDVHIFIEDGRSFVRRSTAHFQVLQATLVDTWASTAAGAFALSENNLYTTNAFVDYLSHLTPDGVMAFTRWGFDPPRESLRVVSLAIAALHSIGQPDPARNIAVVREDVNKLQKWGAQDTILISRTPFTPTDLDRIQSTAATAHMQIVYLPGTSVDTPFRTLLITNDPARFYADYPFDVRPVTDNRPFFFYTVQPRDLLNFVFRGSHQMEDYKINSALPVLFGLVAISIIATFVILALPPLVLGHRLPRDRGSIQALFFFLCIGAGYIVIQVALIQKFILFLGHPTYALTVIIFSMLLSSGCGSFSSRRFIGEDVQKLWRVLLFVILANILLALVVSPICEGGVALPFALKVLITVTLISPLGFAMGMPFPTGLTRLEKIMPLSVRWAWAINAASSVMGSAAAMFFAIYIGLQLTLIVGSLFYLGALLSAMRSPLATTSARQLLA